MWRAGELGRDLVEDPTEEGHRGEDVGLVDAGDMPRQALGAALRGKAEREAMQPLGHVAGDAQGIADLRVADDLRAAMHGGRIEQPLGGLAQDHQVDARRARVGQPLRGVGVGLDRPHPGIELEDVAQAQMWGYFGAVGVAHGGQADGAQEDRVAGRGGLLASGPDILAGAGEVPRAGVDVAALGRGQAVMGERGLGDLQRGLGHVDADAVARNDRDLRGGDHLSRAPPCRATP